jgi:drug/metabolite transporter (DMT)-like permease
MILIVLLYAFLGLSFTLGKATLFFASPFYIVGIRMLIGGIILSVFHYFTQATQYRPHLKDWPYFMQVTLFGILIPYCLRAWGLQYVSSTKAAFLFTLTPFFTALFAYFLHKEKLSFQKSTGLMLGFVGMMPTLFTGGLDETLRGSIGLISFPELALLGAAASFGYNFIALQRLIKHRKCPAVLANTVTMLLGGVLAFSLSCVVEPVWHYKDPGIFFALLALQIVISNLICANLQASLLRTYSSTFMAFASFLVPICASFFGWIFLSEVVYPQYLISLVLVTLGLALFYYDEAL